MPTHKFTSEIIHAAIEGFEQQKLRIDNQIAELRAMLPGGSTTAATLESAPRKRKISAAARRRMALGQQKRWAAIKGTAKSPSSPATPSKPKRKFERRWQGKHRRRFEEALGSEESRCVKADACRLEGGQNSRSCCDCHSVGRTLTLGATSTGDPSGISNEARQRTSGASQQ